MTQLSNGLGNSLGCGKGSAQQWDRGGVGLRDWSTAQGHLIQANCQG